jgi:hypothetical protein
MRSNESRGLKLDPTDRSTDAHRGRGDAATEEQRTENEPPRGRASNGTRGCAGPAPRPVGQSDGQTGKPAGRELLTDGGQERGPVEIYGYEVSVKEVQPRYERFLASTVNREVDKGNEVALRKCVVTIRLRKRDGQSTYQHTYDVTFTVTRKGRGAVARATHVERPDGHGDRVSVKRQLAVLSRAEEAFGEFLDHRDLDIGVFVTQEQLREADRSHADIAVHDSLDDAAEAGDAR